MADVTVFFCRASECGYESLNRVHVVEHMIDAHGLMALPGHESQNVRERRIADVVAVVTAWLDIGADDPFAPLDTQTVAAWAAAYVDEHEGKAG